MTTLKTIDLEGFGKKFSGKVREWYVVNNPLRREASKLIFITTDRISAFDKILGFIPQKGKVLNQLAAFWFEKTKDIIQNHMLSVPDPNVMIAINCSAVPLEMVVRGYITGVTGTSIWGSYEKGDRLIYGLAFPDGLKKNQKLPQPVITPTTKAEDGGHDERLTREDILEKNIVPKEIYEQMEKAAYGLFQRGTEIAEKAGIILVDTKYEFGLLDGKLMLIDEIHTPDSSRFWVKKTYLSRFEKGEEPENFDKEFMRLWYTSRFDPYKDALPQMPDDFIQQVSLRYIGIYEKITGKKFIPEKGNIAERIKKNLKKITL